jgi:hypothetical protein
MKPLKLLEISTLARTNSSGFIPTGFELDPKTTLIHVLGGNDLDHVSKNYPQDVEGQVEVTIAHASNDFHVLDVNINFGLVQKMDVKAGQTISSSSSLVSTIRDLNYVLA